MKDQAARALNTLGEGFIKLATFAWALLMAALILWFTADLAWTSYWGNL